jgi:hypothetical protein
MALDWNDIKFNKKPLRIKESTD